MSTTEEKKEYRFIILFNNGYYYTYTGTHLPGFYLHLLSINIVKNIFDCNGETAYASDGEGAWKSVKMNQIKNNNIG
jgi:hypothetical protein